MRTTLRLVALALLIAALFPSGATRHDRLMVVALEGARMEELMALAESGAVPTMRRLMRTGVGGSILGGTTRDRSAYWRSLFSVGWRPIRVGEGRYVWEALADSAEPAVVVNVPGTALSRDGSVLVLPGADDADGFIGDNTGTVVSLADNAEGRHAWPYAPAGTEIDARVSELRPGQASAWIEVREPAPDDRRGIFRVYRLDRDTAYLTPVYRRVFEPGDLNAEVIESLYVADDPSWVGYSSRIEDYYDRHLSDITASRYEFARSLAAGNWRLFVYFETRLAARGATAEVPSPGVVAPARLTAQLETAYREVDARIAGLVEAAGGATVALVFGGGDGGVSRDDIDARQAAIPTGYFVVSTGRGAPGFVDAPVDRVAPTLLRLVGFEPPAGSEPLRSIVTRFWQRVEVSEPWPNGRDSERRDVPLTARSLRDLDLVTTSAGER